MGRLAAPFFQSTSSIPGPECTFDTDACEVDCNVEGNFETCNPMGGVIECCPNNVARELGVLEIETDRL